MVELTRAEADDLDDGLEYDVQYSEDEGELVPPSTLATETVTHEEPTQDEEGTNPRKRKTDISNLKEKKKMKMELDMQQKKDISLEASPEVITEFINSKISRKHTNLSALELSELYFTKNDIRSTSEFTKSRTLDNLSEYINQRFKNMLPGKQQQQQPQHGKQKNKKNKNKNKNKSKVEDVEQDDDDSRQPTEDRKFIAIVSMSAIRACDIHRATKDLNGSSLKLINKNKLDVDLKLVKSTRSRVLCCTPGRLQKVLNSPESQLQKDEIKIILVDNSYLDQKKQNIWDIKETFEVLKELTKQGSKIYLY
ncbi:hypothetical protein CANMA_000976 [Candida margitis]|uniref:uncharacterized protein n=1 Tax=Candida margitis TaxID=1775924 RepID=UPI002227B17E|nr:uncharacterized protein CANMA_000976 [Candida margitis]KAI5969936.1 hypothetical protein CANMA_000976 [Candida margitis]